jgi:hypothetical protein
MPFRTCNNYSPFLAARTLSQRAITLALATSLEWALALPRMPPIIFPAERFTKVRAQFLAAWYYRVAQRIETQWSDFSSNGVLHEQSPASGPFHLSSPSLSVVVGI